MIDLKTKTEILQSIMLEVSEDVRISPFENVEGLCTYIINKVNVYSKDYCNVRIELLEEMEIRFYNIYGFNVPGSNYWFRHSTARLEFIKDWYDDTFNLLHEIK